MLLALAPSLLLAVPVADPVAEASADGYASGYGQYLPVQQYNALPSAQFHSQVSSNLILNDYIHEYKEIYQLKEAKKVPNDKHILDLRETYHLILKT